MYKAELEDGTTLAVRLIGESSMERFKDFENQVKIIAKLVHPNLVKIHGFYWGTEEKLVIYDFVPNDSLADARYKILSEVLDVHSCDFDTESQRARYTSLLWRYEVTKAKEAYTSDNDDPSHPRNSWLQSVDESAIVTFE
ncbi:hypothetical protein FXO38_34222 [Capsicum annuum]|uniref:Serine-threonine/tyrosine-protein kinase catalytic domain-containing protein n=1 Tax=Capsicum annuum TaxID=4072 RepID=A0A2G2YRJ4_CAPAN|nr:hypothetical protein FXO38_34222 [Capsicum annuum]KAF3684689.1 hypothetical protein FXO37_01228 [Capsicum annuum]PHT72378.1 hypothetical protein T459_23163 [Capsicum annuum]